MTVALCVSSFFPVVFFYLEAINVNKSSIFSILSFLAEKVCLCCVCVFVCYAAVGGYPQPHSFNVLQLVITT